MNRVAESRRAALACLVTAIAIVLGGCASPSAQPTGAAQPQWTGRLSLTIAASDNQPSRGFTASFELRGNAQRGGLDISGPLGSQALKAEWSAASASTGAGAHYSLDTGQGPRSFASLEELASAGLGEPLPLAALFDWLQGRPWPGAPSHARSDGAAGFEQLGWQLDTSALDSGALRATRSAPPAVSLRIRLDNPPSR